MKLIAIQDANILIDLVNAGLFGHCLSLQYNFTTTNLVLEELHDHQVALIHPHINSGKFTVINIAVEDLEAIQVASLENTRLSEQDWSAIFYARQLSALLLTGDRQLRNLAEAKGIEVRGILWVLDQLLDNANLTKKEACHFLQQLLGMNKRLPAEECKKREKLWCGK